MNIQALKELQKETLRKSLDIRDGKGGKGFEALVQAARCMAVLDICTALLKENK